MFGSCLEDPGCVWLLYEGCVFGFCLEDAGCIWFSPGRCWLYLVLAWKMLAVLGSCMNDVCLVLVWRMLGVSWFSSGRCWLCLASVVF